MQTESTKRARPQKALHRLAARTIDIALFSVLCMFYPIGVVFGFFYILLGDRLFHGRSLGKWFTGLKVVRMQGEAPLGVKESVLRNLDLAVVLLFSGMPPVGWILFLTIGITIIGIEVYLLFTDKNGQRIGDMLASTIVVADEENERHQVLDKAIHLLDKIFTKQKPKADDEKSEHNENHNVKKEQ